MDAGYVIIVMVTTLLSIISYRHDDNEVALYRALYSSPTLAIETVYWCEWYLRLVALVLAHTHHMHRCMCTCTFKHVHARITVHMHTTDEFVYTYIRTQVCTRISYSCCIIHFCSMTHALHTAENLLPYIGRGVQIMYSAVGSN